MNVLKKWIGIAIIGAGCVLTGCGEEAVDEQEVILEEDIDETVESEDDEDAIEDGKEEIVDAEEEDREEVTEGMRENTYFTVPAPEGSQIDPTSTEENTIFNLSENERILISIAPMQPGQEGININDYGAGVEMSLNQEPAARMIQVGIQDSPIGGTVCSQCVLVNISLEEIQEVLDEGLLTQEEIDAEGGVEQYIINRGTTQILVNCLRPEEGFILSIIGNAKEGGNPEYVASEINKIVETIEFK